MEVVLPFGTLLLEVKGADFNCLSSFFSMMHIIPVYMHETICTQIGRHPQNMLCTDDAVGILVGNRAG